MAGKMKQQQWRRGADLCGRHCWLPAGTPFPEAGAHLQVTRVAGASELLAAPFLGELPGPNRTRLTQSCLMKSSPVPPGGPTANARRSPRCKNPSSSQPGTPLVLLWLQSSLRDQAESSRHLNHTFPRLSPSPNPASYTSSQASPESTPLAKQNRSQTRSEEKAMQVSPWSLQSNTQAHLRIASQSSEVGTGEVWKEPWETQVKKHKAGVLAWMKRPSTDIVSAWSGLWWHEPENLSELWDLKIHTAWQRTDWRKIQLKLFSAVQILRA